MEETSAGRIDAVWHAALGQMTGGLSPAALATAYLDWSLHMIASPEKQAELMSLCLTGKCKLVHAADPRFAASDWNAFPYAQFAQGFLAFQNWWDVATSDMRGVDPKHLNLVNFAARQWIDMLSPSNFLASNPRVANQTIAQGGQNLLRGARYWVEDFNRLLSGHPRRESDLSVGKDLAVTEGDVVFRNSLIELIRYKPSTMKLRPEPILIVPAWIMKYYILDLTAERSMVAFLRDQGFEVFTISWKNPGEGERDLSLNDYLEQGVMAAISEIQNAGGAKIHAVGYCLGGTLMAIAAAALARKRSAVLASLTLLASQVDFSDPGELGLFINESQVAFLEDMMATRGYLKADQMAGAFQLLRSNDLIWSRVIRHYLLGERTPDNPLMAWNADATRMPAKMHSEYLRRLFLNNELAKGRYDIDGKTVALTDIRLPIYCVATETDHVAPWLSVYRLLLLADTDVRFILTNGGHNSGILSEPGHAGRRFRIRTKLEGDIHTTPIKWFETAEVFEGSWWLNWADWLGEHGGDPAKHSRMPMKVLEAAPGSYIHG